MVPNTRRISMVFSNYYCGFGKISSRVLWIVGDHVAASNAHMAAELAIFGPYLGPCRLGLILGSCRDTMNVQNQTSE
jgi:hypothetical protein